MKTGGVGSPGLGALREGRNPGVDRGVKWIWAYAIKPENSYKTRKGKENERKAW